MFRRWLDPHDSYFAISSVTHALFVSIAITVVVLLLFEYVKNASGEGAVKTLDIGVLAAGTSYGKVMLVDRKRGLGVC